MHLQTKTSPTRDVAITSENAFSNLFLDSAVLDQFIKDHSVKNEKAAQLKSFYAARNYSFAWFAETGLTQQGRSFWNLHNNYVNASQDSSFFNLQLHNQMDLLINDEDDVTLTRERITKLELQLTEHFFDYAQYAYAGKVDPEEIKWHIPRKKINVVSLLDSLVNSDEKGLKDWEPVSDQYTLVRNQLTRLYEIQKSGGWPVVPKEKNTYRIGDSVTAIVQLKKRLYLSGDFPYEEDSHLFSQFLEQAVKRVQKRYGLTQDGVVGPATLKELSVPVEERIRQILVNMERMRWMPPTATGKRLVANIPEFRLHVYEDAKEVFTMKIVVGKAANKTVIFNDQLQHVVFSPYWNVPRSIVRNEILPAMNRNPGYLSQNNMEQTGTSGGLPVIRQKPGGGNALGKVKFIFPNSYNIYFHDTPVKSLFSRDKRAFSHGCIRLQEPKKLAVYLLQHQPQWTDSRITAAMNSGTEKWVALEEPVAVSITYFTAWVDQEGLLNFRDDIYGHDLELSKRLFSN